MRKIISAVVASLIFVTAVCGQASESDTTHIKRSVLIEKDYTPELEPAKRKNIEYSVQELKSSKTEISYSNYVSDIQPEPLFYPLDPQKNKKPVRPKYSKGYFVAGFGYPVAWKAGLYCPVISDYDTDLDIFLDHNGFVKGRKQFISSDLDLTFRHRISPVGDFYGSLNYAHDYNTYYASNTIDNKAYYNTFESVVRGDSLPVYKSSFVNRAGAELGFKNSEDYNGWSYDISTSYTLTALHKVGLFQHNPKLNATVGKDFDGHKLFVSLLYNGQYYAQNRTLSYEPHENNTAMALSPYYLLIRNNLSLQVGAKIWFSFTKGQVVNAMPDVKVNYNIGRFMNVYAVVSGDYRLNSLSSMLEVCPYFEPLGNLQNNTYKPIDAELGFKIKPFAGMLIDVYAGYGFAYNDIVLSRRIYRSTDNVLAYGNTFSAEYLDVHNVVAGARLNYNYQDRYVVHGGVEYNKYRTGGEWQNLWYRPEVEWEVGVETRPIDNLSIDASFLMGMGYTALALSADEPMSMETVKMKNRYNLNLNASYGFKNNISVFLNLENILSLSKSLSYQDWLGYDNRGFMFLGGVRIGF